MRLSCMHRIIPAEVLVAKANCFTAFHDSNYNDQGDFSGELTSINHARRVRVRWHKVRRLLWYRQMAKRTTSITVKLSLFSTAEKTVRSHLKNTNQLVND